MDTTDTPNPEMTEPTTVVERIVIPPPTAGEEWPDPRPVETLLVGTEWRPRLADVMPQFPWPRTLFIPPVGESEEAVERAYEIWQKARGTLPTPEATAHWRHVHADKFARLYALLERCHVKKADDLFKLGCTGATEFGLSLDDIEFMRIGLGGSGVGLPCFVSPTRYCLAHATTGGLQKGQKPHHEEYAAKISRDLTPAERGHSKLVEDARYAESERDAHSQLEGRELPKGWETDNTPVVTAAPPPAAPWKCPEHTKTVWTCRYCVAQAVVEGDVVPTYIVQREDAAPTTILTPPEEVDAVVSGHDQAGANHITVWVRIAAFTRKLSRD